tara:strand:- start:8 stop:586 length:579 start_codon:yes stop_codon:yes gene_type:complete
MPRPAINDYTFYKIVNINGDIDLCYVGSTANFKQRQIGHKYDCNNVNGVKYNRNVYKTIRKHGGWEEFKMVEVGYAEQLTSSQARVIEERYRVELKAELNSIKCFNTPEEKKEYLDNNKEKRSEYSKEYREINKDKVREHKKEYYEANKEKINEKLKEKITCECGCIVRKNGLPRHKRSPKHIDFINNISNN